MRYKDAGVDIEKAEKLVKKLKELASYTLNPQVKFGIGGFSGSFSVEGFKRPIFSLTTDGVGTKLKIAFMMGVHNTVGIDLVAMCVNDLITNGSEPLAFLDYFACGKLEEKTYLSVMEGIIEGCKTAGCSLVGGETAEMPDFYKEGEYDLAGFCVGVCEEEDLIIPNLEEGDQIIGVASSGLHSNGYSLARKVIFEKMKLKVDDYIPELGKSIGEELLTPTKIYVSLVKALKDNSIKVKGIAHITGGAFYEKPKRLLKPGISICIYKDAWDPPVIFNLIKEWGGIPEDEMYKTFNMGVGLLVVVDKEEADRAFKVISSLEKAFPVGEVIKGKGEVILWEGRF